MPLSGRYLGLMSGTSMDGIDAAVVSIDADNFRLERYVEFPYPRQLRDRLERLVRSEAATLPELGSLHAEVGHAFADAAETLLAHAGLPLCAISAIGSHGQTILHRPDARPAFSMQIGDPSVIAWRTGITTVADFRAMDLAAGGQGAPLVPAFHAYLFASQGEDRAVLNIGGIANLSLLSGDGSVLGFDTGPGNTLLDGWAREHIGMPHDEDGNWARSGNLLPSLLEAALADPYFSRPLPKSTGRDSFNVRWVGDLLERTMLGGARPEDVQRTLTELTARSVANALRKVMQGCSRLAVCGGGLRNGFLMERLAACLAPLEPHSTEVWGIPPEAMEACAFAWLAAARLGGESGNLPAVTGAARAVCLGGVYSPSAGSEASD